MPDDQVCQTCHAVVLDMGAHEQFHVGLADFVRQRIEGVERHIRANAQQAMDLIGIEQRDREAVLSNHVARMEGIERGLASVWPRLRGVEDELSGRVAALTEEADSKRSDLHDALRTSPRDHFLYDVASCGECSTAGTGAYLCPNHTALVKAAREEVHGQ